MPNNKKYTQWLAKAGEDELSLQSDLKHQDGAPSSTCFLAQQMTEKYIKGLLVLKGIPFQKTHDLVELAKLVFSAETIETIRVDLETLTEFYVETRYPGDFPEFTWQEAENASSLAFRIKELIMKEMPGLFGI